MSYISQASASAPVDVAPLPPAVAPPASFDSNNCREYQTSVTIDGRAQRAFGRVCRQSDGSWRVVQ